MESLGRCMLQEEYGVLNAQLTANVAVAQAQRKNPSAAARSAAEALSLLKDHGSTAVQSSPLQRAAVPVWRQGPPLPVPDSFNRPSTTASNNTLGLPVNLGPLIPDQNRRIGGLGGSGPREVSSSTGAASTAAQKVLEAAMHDMHACGEVFGGSETGRRVLEVRRAAWEAQIACVKGQ